MKIAISVLVLVFVSVLTNQIGLAQNAEDDNNKKITRKMKEKDVDMKLMEPEDLGTESEEELERQILAGRVNNTAENEDEKLRENDALKKKALKKKALEKKALKKKALKKKALKKKALRKKALRKKALKKKALKKKEEKKQKEVEETPRRGYVRKRGNRECIDALDMQPGISKFNCEKYKQLGLCRTTNELMKKRMEENCAKTCDLCVAPAPAITRGCPPESDECCWNGKPKQPELENDGCPECVNQLHFVCQRFRTSCDDLSDTGNWIREKCPAKCRLCEKPEDETLKKKISLRIQKIEETNKRLSEEDKEKIKKKILSKHKTKSSNKKRRPSGIKAFG